MLAGAVGISVAVILCLARIEPDSHMLERLAAYARVIG